MNRKKDRDSAVLDRTRTKDKAARKSDYDTVLTFKIDPTSVSHDAEAELAVLPPSYGITRSSAKSDNPHWNVSLKRQGRHITKTFYDYLYGSNDEAHAMALSYRNAIVKEIPPTIMRDRAPRNNLSGITGVRPQYDTKERLAGFEAYIAVRGERKSRTFSLTQFSATEAKARAEAQREAWMAEAMFGFMVTNTEIRAVADNLFGKKMVDGHWPTPDEDELDEKLRRINAHFDTLRPFWLTLRVALHPDNRLVLTLSDGGSPAQRRRAGVLIGRTGLRPALQKMFAKTIPLVKELFNSEVAAKFVAQHAGKFDVANFDPDLGISIRERP